AVRRNPAANSASWRYENSAMGWSRLAPKRRSVTPVAPGPPLLKARPAPRPGASCRAREMSRFERIDVRASRLTDSWPTGKSSALLERQRVHAVPKARWGRPVGEDVPEVGVTHVARHFH